MLHRVVAAVRARSDFYLTIVLGIIGWAIILTNSDAITSVLPRYAEF
jgi:hypothetical protein